MTEQEILQAYIHYYRIDAFVGLVFGMLVAGLGSYIGYRLNEKRVAILCIVIGLALSFSNIAQLCVPEHKAIKRMVTK